MTTAAPAPDVDSIVIGVGFAGIYAIHQLRAAGFTVRAFEAGSDVGGVWYWNRYPGARCDVPSLSYQYSFDQALDNGWRWSERFARQPEILRYAQWVADQLEIRRSVDFDTRVTACTWNEARTCWSVSTDTGIDLTCRFLISAAGALSAAQTPPIAGLDTFTGISLHTSEWPAEDIDLDGKTVAVIGTGSSGIQAIPELAARADHVTVFQRSANFSIPARNRPLSEEELDRAAGRWADRRAATFTTRAGHVIPTTGQRIVDVSEDEREAALSGAWSTGGNEFLSTFVDTAKDLEANRMLADFVRDRIREVVTDPDVAELLAPRDHPIGAKRICVDTDYWATFNRDNVQLVDLRSEPIESFVADGLRTTAATYRFDVVVFATGFDALTGALTRITLQGVGGRRLADAWADGARSYLGLAVPGFPNLFTITGPGSPSVLATMIIAIEQHVDWIVAPLCFLREHGLYRAEALEHAVEWWAEQVGEAAAATLYRYAPRSWYLGTNVDGKPRMFLPYAGGLDTYRGECDRVAEAGYRGFELT